MLRQAGFAVSAVAMLLMTGCSSTSVSSADPAKTTAPARQARPAKVSASPSPPASKSSVPEVIPDSYDPSRNPAADLKAALAKARIDHKEVLIDFGANWCPDCKVLDKLFHSGPTTRLLQQNYHVIAVDVGQFNHNLPFVAKYVNLNTSGIPALVVLTPAGSVRVATNDGSFENARTMDNAQVDAFLTKWAPGHR